MKKKCCFMIGLLLIVVLSACGKTQTDKTDVENTRIPVDESISPELIYEGRDELSYAEGFAVDRYEGGYQLISISDGSRFLTVPENREIPEELESDINVIKQPIDHIYLVATASMDMFRALEGIDRISLSGTDADGWYIDEAKRAIEAGDILYAGKYSEPDYELILSEGCRLAIESTMITHAPEVQEQLERLGIPVLVDHASYESHPLGRVEWIKLYGVLLGKEELAVELFAQQEAVLSQIENAEDAYTGKTVAFFYITTNGAAHVRKTSDYIPKIIELAGGTYIFDNLGDAASKSSSMTMQMEEFYAAAKDADYLIYNSSIDGEMHSVDELLAKSALLQDFKAVQEGKVWCTTKNLYQESMSIGGLIADIHAILTESGEQTQYLYRLE